MSALNSPSKRIPSELDREKKERSRIRIEHKRQIALALRAKKQQEREEAALLADADADADADTDAVAESEDTQVAQPDSTIEVSESPKKKARRDTSWNRDTQAGFFLEDEHEPKNGPSAAPEIIYEDAPELSAAYPLHTRCIDCNGEFFNSKLQKQFGILVCDKCRDKHHDEKYSLVTKQTAKEDYLLKDADLGGRPDSLQYIERKNQRNEKWNPYKLYLLCQVEERAYGLYGGEEGLDAEFERREESKKAKAIAKSKKEFKINRKRTLTQQWFDRPVAETTPHQHEYGDEIYNADTDEYSVTCTSCGHVRSYEKM